MSVSICRLPPDTHEYQHTLMYGRYTKELGSCAKEEAIKLGLKSRKYKNEVFAGDELHKYRGKCAGKILSVIGFIWRHSFAKLGEDWVFLALLGVVMAVLSFIVDYGITFTNEGRLWLYKDLSKNAIAQYMAWVSLPVCLILFSAGFVHIVAPQSIGSGIPEMKTILRGVALKEYLTFRTLVAKVIGLTATLGSGLPLGKEGPFVHISSITATLLSKLITSFKGIYENESRNTEMLAAACAVGVASCFGAPLGGVLFSIEVTTVYFAVRNYWRGFFTAVCGATVFRLLAVWFNKADTVKAFFPTHFTMEYPFDPQELTVFAFIGAASGFGGAFYVWAHRQYVLIMRQNKKLNAFLQKNRFLYPGIVTFIAATVSFPLALGKYCASDLSTDEQLSGLFSNFTWTKDEFTIKEAEILGHWTTENTNVFVSLIGYLLFNFIFSIISSTIPVPSGSFIPVFKIGAAFGRIIGELIHMQFPNGIRHGKYIFPIIPGGYATVGAAAFSGAVTHSFSVSVIAFEMTGQITHIIPMMIAVLVANAIAALLQPSLYDSIILIKKLPYLPDLLPSNSSIYTVYVEDFMLRDVKYIWQNMNYKNLKRILKENKRIRVFPLVDNPDSMILLGSVQRIELIKLIEDHVGRERRVQVVAKWQKEAQERLEELERRRRQDSNRRPSRFEVVPAPDILKMKQYSSSDLMQKDGSSSPYDQQPKKSILKKTNSFNLRSFPNLMTSAVATPYSTVTGAESRIRLAFEAIFHKSATLQDANPDMEMNVPQTNEKPSPSPMTLKKVQLPRERVIDMSPEDQREWEEGEMEQRVNFDKCHIDPAPFQLVERTSLLKVHSIFSLVGVNHAYVTAIGRLVGVVGLKELRKAIEDSNAGTLHTSSSTQIPQTQNHSQNVETKLLSNQERKNSDTTSINSALTNTNV
ncbi:chloride channel protein 2 isoform X2 [Planococcus citri]|uniref:chloride channel protein 2 isoform X2 n=1 Tax=Planococcus citri TaxID=170843 RepID=UPI0031F84F59